MKKILIFCSLILSINIINAQFTVTGKVVDDSGVPLPGATIFESMTSNNTTTDFDGNFSLEVGSEGVTIEVSFVGFSPQTIVADSSDLVITLSSNLALDEVVVTSLGITRDKKSLGYAVATVGGDELQDVVSYNALESLQGEVAGFLAGAPVVGMIFGPTIGTLLYNLDPTFPFYYGGLVAIILGAYFQFIKVNENIAD